MKKSEFIDSILIAVFFLTQGEESWFPSVRSPESSLLNITRRRNCLSVLHVKQDIHYVFSGFNGDDLLRKKLETVARESYNIFTIQISVIGGQYAVA